MSRNPWDEEEKADWLGLAERGLAAHHREASRCSATTNAVGDAIAAALRAGEVELAASLTMVRDAQAAGQSRDLVRAVFAAWDLTHPGLPSMPYPSEN